MTQVAELSKRSFQILEVGIRIFHAVLLIVLIETSIFSKVFSQTQGRLIFTHSKAPTSFDPLHGVHTHNLRGVHMLYDSILKVDKRGLLMSRILDKYFLDEANKSITFQLKENLYFSDGQLIELDDLITNLVRICYLKSHDPVLQYLIGIQKWKQESEIIFRPNLPPWLQVDYVKKQLILKFRYLPKNAMHRFSFVLFSIVPRKCITSRGGLKSPIAPSSGPYVLKAQSKDRLCFEQHKYSQVDAPHRVCFLYRSLEEALPLLANSVFPTIIHGYTFYLEPYMRKLLETNATFGLTHESRLHLLVLNSHSLIFRNTIARRTFLEEYRKELASKSFQAEGSVFTSIMPAYKALDQFLPLEQREKEEGIRLLQKHELVFADNKMTRLGCFAAVLKKLCVRLNIRCRMLSAKEREQESKDWKDGLVSLRPTYTGIGAPDPLQDLASLFSKGIQYFLKDFSGDKKLSQLLKESLEGSQDSQVENMQRLNSYLYEQGLFGVVQHGSMFRAASFITEQKTHFQWSAYGYDAFN